MGATYDFDTVVDRRGTWCVQWDGVADRFGVDGLLPFTISDMDFATAPEVLAALRARLEHGVLGYTSWQQDDFRSAIAHWYATRYDTTIDTGQLVYGPSVLNQLSQLLRMWTEEGDGVVVHTPTYDGFRKAITGLGRELRGVPVGDEEALERELSRPDAKVLVLCSPHNPTGRVWTADELARTAALAERYGVAVISDEIHADFVHEGDAGGPARVHVPWTRVAGAGRWALISSGSKAFNFPALTGSYGLIGDPADRAEFVRRMETGEGLASSAVLSLTAHIAAYREGAAWLDAVRAYVAGNLGYVAERLGEAFPELGWEPPQAGYLAWIDLRPLGVDDEELQRVLVEREGVAIMGGAVYGAPGFVRLNVGCPREKVVRGVSALVRAVGAVR
ncbi:MULTISPECIES: MalY/PatB family protein [Streptomyces]|uniref:cysteine-S-conjugate beta-lyase n=3 Tax=Streptomyces TaxID=1883 RepID=A0A6G3SU85_STRAQ|nr:MULTISPECIES: MalY/PatB family protein [Streptomyces]NDZ57299.1 pyridoxal phosphate-dependent aminotransferase [Streptomyces anulatus]NEB86554.1 pyridoxal phosphate-dependent aminotransferase [Streptomyces anulatus]NEC01072.1 pyridoxal phosphate-dependent aminotransferase [Streptomyces anulatus]NED25859.1 pyridoxal phosphate-dependent aminotransferase [Streptomyces anulatus]OLO32027.1 transcriptional regulator [Streptomyces sp. MNU77]